PDASALRQDWRIQDPGMMVAQVRVAPPARRLGDAPHGRTSGLADFNTYPALRRHTALLVGAGHAENDARVQHILAQSSLAWSESANASYRVGSGVDAAMARVDAAWRRDRPVFDWLGLWAGDVPARRVVNTENGG